MGREVQVQSEHCTPIYTMIRVCSMGKVNLKHKQIHKEIQLVIKKVTTEVLVWLVEL